MATESHVKMRVSIDLICLVFDLKYMHTAIMSIFHKNSEYTDLFKDHYKTFHPAEYVEMVFKCFNHISSSPGNY
jgi:hypothetical protein